MQDGAPPHFSTAVRSYLKEIFGADNVISRGCNIPWPPRSPDLTPVDYWFWGNLKARVFHLDPPKTLDQLKKKIKEECKKFTPEEFSKGVGDLLLRIKCMMELEGKHFEHLLK